MSRPRQPDQRHSFADAPGVVLQVAEVEASDGRSNENVAGSRRSRGHGAARLARSGRMVLSARLEPFVRERLVAFLSSRFNGDVALEDLEVSMPLRDPLRVLLNKGRGARVTVRVSGTLLRQRGAREGYPLLQMRGLTFDSMRPGCSTLLWSSTLCTSRGWSSRSRPRTSARSRRAQGARRLDADGSKTPQVVIGRVVADGATLVVLPKDPSKAPLRFDLDRLTLHSAGAGIAMQYVTILMNAKPPGVVECRGTFGPYDTAEPGETPVTGEYSFRRADLAVFKGIAGLLDSSGRFGGN